jgi:hypothetical protein
LITHVHTLTYTPSPGLGLFELFVALIAYGSGEVYEIVMACILGVCGLMYIFFGCMCRNLLGEVSDV